MQLWPCVHWLQPSSLMFLGHSLGPPGSLPGLATPHPSLHPDLYVGERAWGARAASHGGLPDVADLCVFSHPPLHGLCQPLLVQTQSPRVSSSPSPHVCKPFQLPASESPRYLAFLASSLAPTLASLWQLLAPIPGPCSAVARLGTQCRAKHTVGHVGCWGRAGLRVAGDRARPSTEQQAASKAQREQELAANAFQELDDDMDGA